MWQEIYRRAMTPGPDGAVGIVVRDETVVRPKFAFRPACPALDYSAAWRAAFSQVICLRYMGVMLRSTET